MADINEAIKTAQIAASLIIDAEVINETLPATTPAVVSYAKPSMESMGNSTGISNVVEGWIKVDEFGLSLNADRRKFGSMIVEIDMTEDGGFITKQTIKWGSSPVNYASRFDGMLSDKGEPWVEVVARAMRVDPKAKVFPSADIITKTIEDIKQGQEGKPAVDPVKAGTKMGLGLSMSNWQNWVTFYKEVAAAGLLGTVVKVKLTAEEVTSSKNGHTWGVISFSIAA